MMKFVWYFLTALAIFLISIQLAVLAAMASESETTVLTSLDVTQAVGEVLTEGTSIRVVKVIPDGYSMLGQDAYFKKNQETFFESAQAAAAVLTVGGAWSGDPLYKWARRGNIRIVNIDCAKPLDEYGAGVPLILIDGETSPYVWRGPANLTRMASIVADDLCRLAPGDAEKIRDNLKDLQTALFRLRSRYESTFLELDTIDLAAMTADYAYLTNEFGLNTRFYVLTPESVWTEADSRRFSESIRREGVRGVVCAWEPDAKGRRAISDGGAVPVVLEPFTLDVGADPVGAMTSWFDGNLARLHSALKND